MGMRGSGALRTGGRASSTPTVRSPRSGTFGVPTQGEGMLEVDEGIPGPQSLQVRTATGGALRKHPRETLRRGASRAVDNSGFLSQ